jgi:hypothetical protein
MAPSIWNNSVVDLAHARFVRWRSTSFHSDEVKMTFVTSFFSGFSQRCCSFGFATVTASLC